MTMREAVDEIRSSIGRGNGATYERRHHATWVEKNGRSALSDLATWMCASRARVDAAPRELRIAALSDVRSRLPKIASREPTRRHRRHFFWLLRWYALIDGTLDGTLDGTPRGDPPRG